jgi:hypothetical protein
VHDEIIAKLEGASDQDPDDEDEDEVARRAAARQADDERRRKLSDDDAATARRARQGAGDDDRKRTGDTSAWRIRSPSSDATKSSDRKRLSDEDERPRKPRKPDPELTPILARAAAGASVAQRNLTFETRAGFTQVPPRVITTAPSGRVDGEIYPVALVRPRSKWLAPLGLAAAYDKTLFLSIQLPNQPLRAPISQSHYSLGTRYRLILDDVGSFTFGLDYARRKYVADRSGLMTAVLDAPDVDYSAISPTAAAYLPITRKVAAFAGLDFLLMLETGPIQKADSYGAANAYGVEALAGVDIAIAKQIALRVALEYSYIKLSFKGQGTMSTSRDNDPATTDDVTGAADRSLGLAATLGVFY